MTDEKVVYRGTIHVSTGDALSHFAGGSINPYRAVIDYVENSRDSSLFVNESSYIIVIAHKGEKEEDNCIAVIDRATGVTPRLRTPQRGDHDTDKERLQTFWQMVDQGRFAQGRDDILRYVPLRALMNFETMWDYVAKSWKRRTLMNVFGRRGIGGSSGWRGLGDKGSKGMLFVTRPRPTVLVYNYETRKLEEQAFGSAYAKKGEPIPAFKLKPIDADMVEKTENPPVEVIETTETVLGRWKKVCGDVAKLLSAGNQQQANLDSLFYYGTRVEIYGVPDSVFKGLKLEGFLRALQAEYGNLVYMKKTRIFVVDDFSKQGKSFGGVAKEVPPIEFQGSFLVNGVFDLDGPFVIREATEEHVKQCKEPVFVQIRLDRGEKFPGVHLFAGDFHVCMMQQIQTVGSVWDAKALTGIIQVSSALADSILTTSKDNIRGSKAEKFIVATRKLEKILEQHLQEQNKVVTASQRALITKIAREQLLKSMEKDPFFKQFTGLSGTQRERSTPGEQVSPPAKTDITIRVVDQNAQPVAGIPVGLWKEDLGLTKSKPKSMEPAKVTTTSTAGVSFKNVLKAYGEGRYIVAIQVDENIPVSGGRSYVKFYIDQVRSGGAHTFTLELPEPQPKPLVKQVMTEAPAVNYSLFEEGNQLAWYPEFELNKLWINSGEARFADADQKGDTVRLVRYIATYIAFYSAVKLMQGEDPVLIIQRTSAFAPNYADDIMEILMAGEKKAASIRKR